MMSVPTERTNDAEGTSVSPLPEPPWRIAREQVLGASAPWLGAVLNVLPGLGTGYIYQRRWRAYWFAGLLAAGWLLLSVRLPPAFGPLNETDHALLGTSGLLVLAMVTAVEAFLAARRARQTDG